MVVFIPVQFHLDLDEIATILKTPTFSVSANVLKEVTDTV